jgi:DNA-binding MarR family transcriptional regulator
MFDSDSIIEMLIDNVKKLFFPDEWIKMDLKFSKTEIFTLLFLDRNKQVTMTELVEYINSPMSTATGIVDRLVKNGYIKRDRSETDRRIVVLALTDAGSKLIKDFKNMISKYLEVILDDLSEEEKQFLLRIVFKVMNKLQTEMTNEIPGNKDKVTIKKIDIE